MTALPNYPNVIAIHARRVKIAPGNSVYAPQSHGDEIQHALREWDAERGAPMAVDVPCMVNLDPPPAWAARRRQMRRDALMVIAGAVGFMALIGFAMVPDTAVVQAQMEDAQ